jgi:hypothetical protein
MREYALYWLILPLGVAGEFLGDSLGMVDMLAGTITLVVALLLAILTEDTMRTVVTKS